MGERQGSNSCPEGLELSLRKEVDVTGEGRRGAKTALGTQGSLWGGTMPKCD